MIRLLAVLALVGCSPQTTTDLSNFALADLRAAQADAVAAGDIIAAPCWEVLARLVEARQPVVGAFSAFQRARDVRIGASVKLGCAALVMDEQLLVLRLGRIAAGLGL